MRVVPKIVTNSLPSRKQRKNCHRSLTEQVRPIASAIADLRRSLYFATSVRHAHIGGEALPRRLRRSLCTWPGSVQFSSPRGAALKRSRSERPAGRLMRRDHASQNSNRKSAILPSCVRNTSRGPLAFARQECLADLVLPHSAQPLLECP
jgi:hypothetical protein